MPVLKIGEDGANENEVLGEITDVAIGSSQIYILDSKFFRVQIYDKSKGNYYGSFGKKGMGPGEFNSDIRSIKLDQEENVVIGGVRKIYIFDRHGKYLNSFFVDFQMNDLCVDKKGIIFALGYKNGKIIHAYNQEGKYLFSFGEPFEVPSNFSRYKHIPVFKLALKIFYTNNDNICVLNPYKYEVFIYKNQKLLKKFKQHSAFFKEAKSLEFHSGAALMIMGNAIFEYKKYLFVSLFDIDKAELDIFENNNFYGSIILNEYPLTIDSDGYLYLKSDSENPHIIKAIIKPISRAAGS